MATEEERMKILKMIQEGCISVEQGVQLLEVLDEGVRRAARSRPGLGVFFFFPLLGRGTRWFRVLVTDISIGKTCVNVRLSIGLVSVGIKMGVRFAPEVEGLDAAELMKHLNSGETGKIVDVYDDADGEHVEVFIE